MASGRPHVAHHVPMRTNSFTVTVPVSAPLAVERIEQHYVARTRPRNPDGMGDESPTWTYREQPGWIRPLRVRRTGCTVVVEGYHSRAIGPMTMSYRITHTVDAISDSRSRVTCDLTHWCGHGLTTHLMYQLSFVIWARRLRRDAPANPRRSLDALMCLLVALASYAVVGLIYWFAQGHTRGGSALLIAATLTTLSTLALRRSATALRASMRAALFALVAIGICAWWLRHADNTRPPAVLGTCAAGFMIGGAATAIVLSIVRRRVVAGLAAGALLVTALAVSPAVLGRSLGPLDALPDSVTTAMQRDYPYISSYRVFVEDLQRDTEASNATPLPTTYAANLPPLGTDSLHPASLPPNWTWRANADGGHIFSSPDPLRRVTTASATAPPDYDTSDLVRTWLARERAQHPDIRVTSRRASTMRGTKTNAEFDIPATELAFSYRHAGRGSTRMEGLVQLTVVDGTSYSAMLTLPADTTQSDKLDASNVLTELRIVRDV